MAWILATLAAFNVSSMLVLHKNRLAPRMEIPWTRFGYSLLTSELAWVWLPVQVLAALVLVASGALSSSLGVFSILALMASWGFMTRSIRQAFQATDLTESALREELGSDYRASIPETIRGTLEQEVGFEAWRHPFAMPRPGVERIANTPYGPGGIKQQLDIYRPLELPEAGCPVLLQIHGGAWMYGSKDHQALPLMYYMASKGWICVAINYRLAPSVDLLTLVADCKRALGWIRGEGRNYGMNPGFVAVTGGSAGGHLTALLGLTGNLPALQKESPEADTTVQAVVPFYGLYDLISRYDPADTQLITRFASNRVIYESPEQNPELWDLLSPVMHVGEHSPPFMIIQGGIDSLTTVTGARIFHGKLSEASNKQTVYLELPGAEHAFDCLRSPRTEPVIRGVHRFLEWARALS